MTYDSTPILQLQNISRYYNENFSLSDISLDLSAGEVHVIVGENGSGKSNLMHLIAGIDPPDSGMILFDGKQIRLNSAAQARQIGIYNIFQGTNLFLNLSVAENIYYERLSDFKVRGGIDFLALQANCRNLIESLGIKGIEPLTLAGRLNFAQRQLVEIAKASISHAKVIIFDEPSSALTQSEQEILFSIIDTLKSQNIGILYISHRLDEIKRVGNRISVIRDGRIIHTSPVDTVNKKKIIDIMTGASDLDRFPKLNGILGKTVLEVQGLSYENILNNVSFRLRRGEILGIAGLIGSGRTCLAKCLSGLIRYDSGLIKVNGSEVKIRSVQDSIRHGLALIPEYTDNNMFELFDIKFNITLPSLLRFKKSIQLLHNGYLTETANEYIRRFDISPSNSGSVLNTLSNGNRQKVSIAKWIMRKANIYIMDEPTRGIDIASRVDIYNCMNDLVSKGASIIFISSDIDELIGMCDRILILAEGAIVLELSAAEATRIRILDSTIQ